MTDERVVELEVPWTPAAGVPAPVLIQDEAAAVLVYLTAEIAGDRKAFLAFPGCCVSKFGYPNDEALPSHPSFGAGLRYYGIFEVFDSEWFREVRTQNLRSFPGATTWGEGLRHFIVTFHDSTFECLARDLVGDFSDQPIKAANAVLMERTRRRLGSVEIRYVDQSSATNRRAGVELTSD